MHPHRSDDAARRASPSRPGTADAIPAELTPARVVGLGAPVSVLLRPANCEVPLLAARVQRELDQHRRERPDLGPKETVRELMDVVELEHWEREHAEWERMLSCLDGDGPLELLWATAYAAPVLRGRLEDALATIRDPRVQADGLSVLAAALRAASECLATRCAFDAVDNGGLQDVRL